jgi:hypothetical protein
MVRAEMSYLKELRELFLRVDAEVFDGFGDGGAWDGSFFGEGVEGADDCAGGVDFEEAAEIFAGIAVADAGGRPENSPQWQVADLSFPFAGKGTFCDDPQVLNGHGGRH